jgi:carbonic anhydrase
MKTKPKTCFRALAAASLALALGACSSGGPAPSSAAAPGHELHWGYETEGGTIGPAGWGSLPGDVVCSTGTKQSPVALASSIAEPAPNALSFAYGPTPLRITNNGHTQQVDAAAGRGVTVDGVSYPLLQFHFHSPSEHTLDGKQFPLEMHLVHAGADGKPAVVVGVLFEEGAANAALAGFFANLPKKKGTAEPAGLTIDSAAVLPASHSFLHYGGSLTTPPCSEGIRWFVLTTPVTVSKEQVAAYVGTGLDHTNRPLQPLGGRALLAGGKP